MWNGYAVHVFMLMPRSQSRSDGSEGRESQVVTDGKRASPAKTVPTMPNDAAAAAAAVAATAPTSSSSPRPNRSFSSTTLLGHVPVIIFLPGMSHPIAHSTIPKRQHTRLPHHRPPLRRDKPVRISIPGQAPRYIFPSTERSFIFIPRALRPNQQSFRGGRGRGGGFHHAGRRPTSIYVPNRRLSIAREGFSPAASIYPRPYALPPLEGGVGKPIVRLPPVNPHVVPVVGPAEQQMLPAPPPRPALVPHPQQDHQRPAYRESRPAPIPMHQPRPQKAVSVADIESPASFLAVNPPQPQQEQPFHQQVPVPVNGGLNYGPTDQSVTSQSSHAQQLSHIPERAIHARPFQPYDVPQQQQQQQQAPPAPTAAQGFYPSQYPAPAAYYPEYGPPSYNTPMANSYAPQFPYMVPSGPADQQTGGTIAHEAGGTVYFYDAGQMTNTQFPPFAPGGSAATVAEGTTPPSSYYYAHQAQPNMYYSSIQ